ncbi:hypothetical protein M441DRAFT_372434 [Trichoderma asperellum CBS 433.97]|uniref:Transmembrane protein n=1 Tax=Trichoderma asperellum (strain ATCC 204424 / CBS 433.97 / NBRC 101777) TaxID=1042311 RepID=A0A2T3ZF56_TRIA4|nr:hypothetical protein M441DRAFT_372434 [Trichoderma asperellum CBS 433.97]PTB43434.1 hypothetical protein M441DRAFT_372434 [Trichoderma asperellum CBS 433.97]
MSPSSRAHKAAKRPHLRSLVCPISNLQFVTSSFLIKCNPIFVCFALLACLLAFPMKMLLQKKKKREDKGEKKKKKNSSPYASYRTLLPFFSCF